MLLFMVPYGFAIGVTALMGNAIGEEDIKLAKLTIVIGFVLACLCTFVQGYLSYNYSIGVAQFYTQDMDVVPILSNVIKSLSVPIVITAFTLIP